MSHNTAPFALVIKPEEVYPDLVGVVSCAGENLVRNAIGGLDMVSKGRGHGEGQIRRRPDGTWEARISDGVRTDSQGKVSRRRKSLYGKTRAEVAAKLTTALKDQQQGLPLVGERATIGELLQKYLAEMQTTVRASTLRSYEQIVRLYLIPELGHIRVTALTPQDVTSFMGMMVSRTTRSGRPYSAASVQRMRAVLRQALALAESGNVISRNVAKLARPPRGSRRKAVALSTRQAKTFLAAIAGDRLEVLFRVALALGLRQGEALGLRWANVDLEGGFLTVSEAMQRVLKRGLVMVPPKSESGNRKLKLPHFLIALLRRHAEQQAVLREQASRWSDNDLVFCTRFGTPFDGPNITKVFQRSLSRVGLPKVRYQDLRHSAISFLAADGVPLEVAQEIAGHSDVRLTANVYRHVLEEEHEHAAAAMERRFGE